MNEGDNSYAISPWGPRAKQLTMIRCNLIALHPPQTSLKRSSYESGLTGFDSVVSVHSNNNMLSRVVKSNPVKRETSFTVILSPTASVLWPFIRSRQRERERKRRKRIDNRTNRNVVRTNLQQSAMILCPYNIGNFIKTVFEQTLKGNIWLLFTSGASNEQIPFEQANIVPLYSCVVPNYLPT